MFRSSILLFVTVVLLAIGCNNSQETSNGQTVELIPSGNITFQFDSNSSNQGRLSYFSTNDGKEEYLVFFNKPSRTLTFYDYPTLKEVNRITFPRQGPNSIPSMIDVRPVAKDSIFILSSYVNKMYLADWKGTIYNDYSLLDKGGKSEISFGFEMSKNKVYFQTMALANMNNPQKFYSIDAGVSYDLQNKKSTAGLFSYPDCYKTGEKWGTYHNVFYQTIGKNGELVISFPLDPNLHILRDGKKSEQINCPSRFFDKKVIGLKANEDPNHYYIKQNAYDKIIYDKYRNVYYRVATIGQPDISTNFSPLENPGMYKSTSILILNDSFEVTGETMLPKNTYNHQSLLVTKDGLYLAKTHPLNPDLSESEITLERFVMKSNNLTKIND